MLNAQLYSDLCAVFGDVKVLHEDEEWCGKYVSERNSEGRVVRRLVREGSSEEYAVNCPFCNDTRRRLTINHRWGAYDPETESHNLQLARCFNEECLSEFDNVRELHDRVVSMMNLGAPELNQQRRTKSRVPGRVVMPGTLRRVDKLAETHPAKAYLRDRLYDVEALGELFGVGYCADSDFSGAVNRIVAPVLVEGKCRGWTARFIGDPPKGVGKWQHMPGMTTANWLYNCDNAAACPTKILVEGPGDVWGIGRAGLGCFGKHVSEGQITLLRKIWRKDDVLVVLFDPAPDKRAKGKDKKHHIETAYEKLNSLRPFRQRVIKVYLPQSRDPGDSDRAFMFRRIRQAAEEKSLPVTLQD